MSITYTTSEIAKIAGLHPNTVRRYEEWGLIQKPERKKNGYRVYKDIHIKQFELAKKAFQIEILQADLRKRMVNAVKLSAVYRFDEAIELVEEYILIAEQEIEHAKEAAGLCETLYQQPEVKDISFSMRGSAGLFLVGYLLVMISMFSIGMMVGGLAKNSKIAGVIASALYFPMLLFSGATIPYEIMPGLMQKIVNVLPLTQGIKILKNATLGLPIDNVTGAVIFMLMIAIICSIASMKFFRWE